MSARETIGGLRTVRVSNLRTVTLDEVAAVVLIADNPYTSSTSTNTQNSTSAGVAPGPQLPDDQPPPILRAAIDRLGLAAPSVVARTAAGRPFLVHPNGHRWDVDFNISHSGELVGIAIGRPGRLGLDIQELPGPGWQRIGRRWLPTREWARIDALPPADGRLEFTRAWTVREARCKATGMGLAGFRSPTALPAAAAGRLDGVYWRELPMPHGFAAALAWAGPPERRWLTCPIVVCWETPWTR